MPHTKKYFDVDFFLKENEDFYYFLGYFCGDGCLSSGEKAPNQVYLGSTDSLFIDNFRNKIKAEFKKYVQKGREGWRSCYSVVLNNKCIFDRLVSLGVPLRKSYCRDWDVKVPNVYMKYFLRGFLDSDGCVWKSRTTKNLQIYFLSSSARLLERVKEFLIKEGFPIKNKVLSKSNIFKLQVSRETRRVFDFIYYPELEWDLKEKRKRGESLLLEVSNSNS